MPKPLDIPTEKVQYSSASFEDSKLGRRLRKKIDFSGECWVWTAYVEKDGYGKVKMFPKVRLAHRVVYEHLVGPIPEGMQLDHTCSNRRCVNPLHLEPVTPQENSVRSVERRAILWCPRGHEYTEWNTLWKQTNKRNLRSVQRVCRSCMINRGRAGSTLPQI